MLCIVSQYDHKKSHSQNVMFDICLDYYYYFPSITESFFLVNKLGSFILVGKNIAYARSDCECDFLNGLIRNKIENFVYLLWKST